jgi:dTDP-4-dehydrorhamnose reductase/dTDP-4-dehydrorhamnose 3,5-epimerase
MAEKGINTVFVQDNQSFSKEKGTLRGLHFQNDPKAQTKLVRCTRGRILDVAVDIRKGSPTFRKWVAVELTAENFRQLYLPKGFAHAFVTLTDDVEVQYKVDEYYAPDCDRASASTIATSESMGRYRAVLSQGSRTLRSSRDSDCNFVYDGNL